MRQYLIGSWNNADSYDYSGEQLMGNRLGASREVPHFLANGRANVEKYGDNTEKKSSISIQDKILPQKKRLNTLRSQMVELEREYKTTDMSVSEYSVLRDVLVAKVQRAEGLYRKAIAQKPVQTPEDEDFSYASSLSTPSDNNRHRESYSSPVGVGFFAEVVDGLSDGNSLKSFLKMSCKAIRKAIHFKHKAARYLNELKEVYNA